MAVNPVPNGYHTITPYLIINEAQKFIDFLIKAFDAVLMDISRTPEGVIRHAEIRIGDSMMMLTEATEQYTASPGHFYLYVNDIDSVYKQALSAGATSIMEPADQFYGDRNAGVKDSFGNIWWIGTHIEDVSSDEIKKREAELKK
ncbi:MAG TPA: VOC family protein [Ignavibacteria bacterium]|nr:VOC family protein [Ignavibacteria bacterium]